MFAKLLKYEWKANARVFGLLSLATVGVGALAAIVLRLMVNYADDMVRQSDLFALVIAAMSMMLMGLFLAILLYAVAIPFLLLYRFYKNKYTDEGYLTFTLPVTCDQIFLSSLVNMLVWTVISMIVAVGVAFSVLWVGTATDTLVNPNFIKGLGSLWDGIVSMIRESNSVLLILYPLLMVVSLVSGVIVCMTCITIGAVAAKKHKLLAAFGIYYAVQMGASMVRSMFSIAPTIFMLQASQMNEEAYLIVTLMIQLVIQILLGVGGYYLSTGLMKRKLNLP